MSVFKEPITFRDFVPPILFKINFFAREVVLAVVVFSSFVLGVLSSSIVPSQMERLGYLLGNMQYQKQHYDTVVVAFRQKTERTDKRDNVNSFMENTVNAKEVLGVKTVKRDNVKNSQNVSREAKRVEEAKTREVASLDGYVEIEPEEDGAWVSFRVVKNNRNRRIPRTTGQGQSIEENEIKIPKPTNTSSSEILGVKTVKDAEDKRVKDNFRRKDSTDQDITNHRITKKGGLKEEVEKDKVFQDRTIYRHSSYRTVTDYYSYPDPSMYK